MKGFKATYNMECLDQTYEVGETYEVEHLKICHSGFHFCQRQVDTIRYYHYSKEFILLEVEALGKVVTEDDKSVTNRIKILRVVPKEEYDFATFDDRGNMISKTYPNGDKYSYEYDDRNNKISKTYPNGDKYSYEYDDRNNKISVTYPNGDKYYY